MVIDNFMSFDKQEFVFDSNNLVLVIGNVNDSDSSNGAGKSALFEALVWCLYGKTIRDIGVNKVIRSGASYCNVRVEFLVVNGNTSEVYVIERRRTNTSGKVRISCGNVDLTGSSMAETDRKISDVLGMSFELFVNTVFYGQGLQYRFIQETDRGKKEVLEEILNLSWIDGIVKKLRELKNIYDMMSSTNKISMAKLEAELKANRELISRFSVDESNKQLFNKLVGRRDALVEEIGNRKRDCEEYNKMTESLLTKISSVRAKLTEENQRLRELNNDKSKFAGDELVTCPLCFSDVSSDEAKSKVFDEYDRRILELVAQIDIDKSTYGSLSSDYEILLRDVSALDSRILELEGELDSVRSQLFKAEAELREADVVIEMNGKIANLSSEFDKCKIIEKKIDDILSIIEFWHKAFNVTGIRVWIIEKILPYLNDRLNHYLDLFDTEFDLMFTLGEEGERIHSSVMRDNIEMDYGQLSGGEKRRLDVAVLLALGDLFQVRFQHSVSIRVFDEVCENLDSSGIESLMIILAEKSRDSGVYVISHSQDMPDFSKVVVVKKGLNGVSQVGSMLV